MGKQDEAIESLELARDESFRASKHIMAVTNAYLARAYLMLNQIDKSVQAGQEFYKKAQLLQSPHARSRAYRLLNTIETAGYGDVQAVKDFRHMLDNEEKNGLKEIDGSYLT